MRKYLKWPVNHDQGIANHRGPQEHRAKALFSCERRIAPVGDMRHAQALKTRGHESLGLRLRPVFVILFDQGNVHHHILIRDQRHIRADRRRLLRMRIGQFLPAPLKGSVGIK